jgi:hypothetical protein
MNSNSKTFKGKFVTFKETFESHIIHSNNVWGGLGGGGRGGY